MSSGPNVVQHLDEILGVQEDQRIWSFKEDGFWVLEYTNTPTKHANTYLSTGLGRHVLGQNSGTPIRQELLMTVWEEYSSFDPAEKVASLSFDLLERHIPIPNHQVIPWHGGIFGGLKFSALYCTGARHMAEEMEVIEGDPNLVFVWLIPIYPSEQEFCKEMGWQAFEDKINKQQPDFFNLERPTVKLD